MWVDKNQKETICDSPCDKLWKIHFRNFFADEAVCTFGHVQGRSGASQTQGRFRRQFLQFLPAKFRSGVYEFYRQDHDGTDADWRSTIGINFKRDFGFLIVSGHKITFHHFFGHISSC